MPGEEGFAGLQVVCTGTRDCNAAEAKAAVAQAFAGVRDAELFKKIDSVFRGNTFTEVAATVRALPGYTALIAPAFPAMGRRLVEGVLHVEGQEPQALHDLVHATGLHPAWVSGADSVQEALERGEAALFCDAATEDEMKTMVRAALASRRQIVWIGSGGLAHALAAEWYGKPGRPHEPEGPMVVMSGSNHPVTQGQLTDLTHGARVLRIERFSTEESAIRNRVRGARTLVLVGGDTAVHVCRALEVRMLRIFGEYEPGIAQGVLCGGPCDGMGVVLKSGGFGKPDLLRRLLEVAA